jgi:hypothetical protein
MLPWRVPMSRDSVADVLLPTPNNRGKPIRKSSPSPRLGGHYGVECQAVVSEQHSHIGVLLNQVEEGSVECSRDCIIYGSVGVVCKLSGSRVPGMMWAMTSLSKHFMATDVSSTWR